MREALEAKLQSLAHREMLALVESGKAGHQTLAYLGNKGYIEKDKVGRPTKKATEKAAEKLTKEEQAMQKELERITAHNPKIAKLHKVK
jgi:hypothetical protein